MSLTAKKVYAILNGKIVKINGIIETIKHPVIYQGSVKRGALQEGINIDELNKNLDEFLANLK